MNANSANKIAPTDEKSVSAAETAEGKSTKTKQLPDRVSKAVTLEYVRQLLIELRGIAQAEGEGTLVYLLEMSALEAQECLKVHRFNTELID
ncbi:MAG: hypothetical protein AAF362_17265 [Pseudomonadota bacterium]